MRPLLLLRRMLPWVRTRPRTFALVGRSGTGKSHRARHVAQRFHIDLIIDDGLLIRGQKILAGRSAKREKGILTAIKTAVFANPDHIAEVKRAIAEQSYHRILIIGTSVKMIQRIAGKLGLLPIHKIINIADVSSGEDIARALRIRAEQGKHIIPVPSVEVKRNYPHIFFESVKILLKGRKGIRRQEDTIVEKTVVRPEYSKVRRSARTTEDARAAAAQETTRADAQASGTAAATAPVQENARSTAPVQENARSTAPVQENARSTAPVQQPAR